MKHKLPKIERCLKYVGCIFWRGHCWDCIDEEGNYLGLEAGTQKHELQERLPGDVVETTYPTSPDFNAKLAKVL